MNASKVISDAVCRSVEAVIVVAAVVVVDESYAVAVVTLLEWLPQFHREETT